MAPTEAGATSRVELVQRYLMQIAARSKAKIGLNVKQPVRADTKIWSLIVARAAHGAAFFVMSTSSAPYVL